MLNLRKQLKNQGCSRENISTFNIRIKDVAESSTMTALRRWSRMPTLQKRDVLVILNMSVVHGNNSILHLLKLQKRGPLNSALCGRAWGGGPAVQGLRMTLCLREIQPCLGLLTLSWCSWCVRGWVSQHQSVKLKFCVENRSFTIHQYDYQHRRYKTEVKREVWVLSNVFSLFSSVSFFVLPTALWSLYLSKESWGCYPGPCWKWRLNSSGEWTIVCASICEMVGIREKNFNRPVREWVGRREFPGKSLNWAWCPAHCWYKAWDKRMGVLLH